MTAVPTRPSATTGAPRLRRLDLAATDAASIGERTALCRRGASPDEGVRTATRSILDDVRARGAAAVRDANERFGGGLADERLVIERAELRAARDALSREDRAALDQAIAHVRRFAEPQLPVTTRTEIIQGIEIERRWRPLDRVGCYVPGGSAPYPSSLVMTVIPARVAGVGSIVVASPAGADGTMHPVLLGAAGLLEVAGFVGIDLPAGPSEGMVLADDRADPVLVAADLVTQAEHGPDSPAILVTTSSELADAVEAEIARLLPRLERREILARALAVHGRIALAPDVATALAFVDAYAPEHLSIDVGDSEAAVDAIHNAGSIFVGPWAPESAGDYATGANHVLPTGGLARACNPLGVEAFGRFSQVQRVDQRGLAAIRTTVERLATVEGLTAHRNAITARFDPPRSGR